MVPRSATPWFRTSSPELIGREQHLAVLREAAASRPAVVLVEGEAGVGKSRLVAELLGGGLGPVQPLVGHCRQVGEPFSYGALLEAVRGAGARLARAPALSPVTGMLAALLPEIAEHLPAPLPPIGDPRAERHRLFRAVRELLDALGPALLVVEDLQWADDGTRQLLRFLTADPPPELATVVTYRREDLPGGSPFGAEYRPTAGALVAVLELGPLDVDQVRALTGAILDEEVVSTDFAAKLHERTAGIPFVVEEALRALRDPAGAVHAGGARARRLLDAVEVPVLLRDAMAERLAALPTAAVRLVRAAAVLGVPSAAELLAEMAGVPASRLRVALTHAVDGHVLHEVAERRYGFRHSLARQAVHDTISAPERTHLHDRAVDALARIEPPPLVQLAEHSERAGRTAAWLSYGEAAADRATAAGDAATATTLLQRLLTVEALPGDAVNRMAIKLGRIAHGGLDQRDPTETLERVLDDPRLSTSVRGEVRLYRALLLIRQLGRLREARSEFERAIGELGERPDLVGRATAVLATPYYGVVPAEELAIWRRRAARCRAGADGEWRITLLANELGARLHLGERVRIDVPETAATPEGRRQLARLRCNIADACVWVGHLDVGDEHLRDGLRLAAENDAPYLVSTGRTTEARLDWLTARWSGLARRTRALIDEYRDVTTMTSELELVLGWLAMAHGDWADAGGHFAATGAGAPEEAVTPVALSGAAGLAQLHLARHDPAAAVVEVERALAVVRAKLGWTWTAELAPVAVDAYAGSGRTDDARRLVAEIASGVSDLDAPIVVAALARCRGAVAEASGEHADAVGHYREAVARYERLPAPYFAALAAEREALCLVPTDPDKAVDLLGGLVDAFDGIGAPLDAARCRHALHGLGGAKPVRRGRRGYGNELSPREVEVARMLTEGRTNREIAELLFLSQRTVEQHVARLFRKLGIHSRAQLRTDDLG